MLNIMFNNTYSYLVLIHFLFLSSILSNMSAQSTLQSVTLFVDDQIEKKRETSSAVYARENLSASLSGKGFQVITHETVSKSLSNFSKVSDNNPYSFLSDNNIQTLSQQLGADYFLILTLNEFSSEIKDLPSFDRKIYTHRLDANFRLMSSSNSGALLGKNVPAIKRIPVTSKILIQSSKQRIINELIDEVVEKVVSHVIDNPIAHKKESVSPIRDGLKNPNRKVAEILNHSNNVNILISAKFQNLVWPEISKDENQTLTLTGRNYQLEATDAEVEVDGVFVGNSSPTETISVMPGLKRLKVIRSGFVVQEKMINAHEGLKLSLTLKPTDEEYNRWQSQISFLQNIKIGEKLTEIEARKAEGLYEFLKNSKYELPQNVTFKSLY